KDKCVDCHRGSNSFIAHAQIPSIHGESSTPYRPIAGGDRWKNEAADKSFAPKCQTCHILPKLTKDYCDAVLLPSLDNKKSESGGHALMPPDSDDYDDDIKQIREACKDAKPAQ